MTVNISHEEFCEKTKDHKTIWGVNNFWLSIIYALKFQAAIIFSLFFFLFILSISPILYFAYSQTSWFLIFVIIVFIAILWGKPNLNLVNLAFWFIIFLISGLGSVITGYEFYRIGFIPLICFFISSALKGIILGDVEKKLITSTEVYQLLKDKKQLLIYESSNNL